MATTVDTIVDDLHQIDYLWNLVAPELYALTFNEESKDCFLIEGTAIALNRGKIVEDSIAGALDKTEDVDSPRLLLADTDIPCYKG